MNKCLFFTIIVYTSNLCFATSSISGISKKGFFDFDNIPDMIQCEYSKSESYDCIIKTSKLSKLVKIKNNKNCSDLSIIGNKNIKGDIIIQCGIWGVNNTYYYKYDQYKKNWFIYKHIYEKLPMNPDDDGYYFDYDKFTKKWTLNDDFNDINNDLPKILSLKKIESSLKNNSNDILFDFYYFERVFIKYKLSNKNITQYNNIAYYLEQRGQYKESIFLLEKIIEKYPSRTVAYINLGDAYWGLKEKDKAINAYQKYIKQMKQKGKEKRIPQKVLDRVVSSASKIKH